MKIEKMFSELEGRAAFMPYVCCGDPSVEFSVRLVETLVSNGADAIELGIPFSDPIADGKTIEAASSRALANGMTPKKAFEAIAQIRGKGITAPIIAMTYYNIVFAKGTDIFLKSLAESGADGLIVPDVPLEESGPLHELCAKNEIDLIYLITPNCSEERIGKIAERANGFLYAVSVLGITGAREKVANEAIELIRRAKKITKLPIVVGFGISKPEHARILEKAGANGIIVGSALVNIYSRRMDNNSLGEGGERLALEEIADFTRQMKAR